MFSKSQKYDGHDVSGQWKSDFPWCDAERNDNSKQVYQHAEEVKCFQCVQPEKNLRKMLLQHNNAMFSLGWVDMEWVILDWVK
jgi:hypothetical protein